MRPAWAAKLCIMILRPPDLPRRLPATAPAVCLVIGDEPLFVSEAADQLRAHLRGQGFEERLRYDGLEEDALYAESQAGSLFATRKILEVDVPEAKVGQTGGKFISRWLKEPPPDICLLLVAHCERMPRATAWMKAVQDQGLLIRGDALERAAIPGWLEQRARAQGLELSADAVEWMTDRTEGALMAAAQDLQKLGMLGLQGRLDRDTVEQSVADAARFAVFALPDACLEGDLVRARRIALRLRAEGAPAPLLNFALARDLRSLLKLAKGSSPQAAGVWQSRAPLFNAARRRLKPAVLGRLHHAMVGLDQLAKSRPEEEYWEDLLNFVHVFAGGTATAKLPFALDETLATF